jgi:penicillin-binding protein 1C
LALFALGVVAAGITFYILIWPLLEDLPSPDNVIYGNYRFNVASQVFDRNGELLFEFFEGGRRIPVSLDELPDYVWQATIAIEDRNFFNHFGFDPRGIIRSFFVNLDRGGTAQGGSTITQQLMKNAFLTAERSYARKIQEVVLAIITEMRFDKYQILEMYLNFISYGGIAEGIASASDIFFDKAPQDLTLAEAAMLAGLPQAPSRHSPFSSMERAKARQRDVLNAMVEMGFITEEEADEAFAEEIVLNSSGFGIEAPHFVFYVRDQLIDMYGEDMVNRGGLRITTTLDLSVQQTVQATVSAEVENSARLGVGNGAALVTRPGTGEILAMVGSADYFDSENDGQVNVTTAFRQPGSAIKPLVYLTAFEQRILSPASVILDIPTCFQVIGQGDYCPRNFDGGFRGPQTIRDSLGNSWNIPAVRVLRMIGLESFIYHASQAGITNWLDPRRFGLSIALGGGDVTMVDMAQVFGVMANEGVKVPLISILSVEDHAGNILHEVNLEEREATLRAMQTDSALIAQQVDGEEFRRVFQSQPVYMINHVMRDNRARAAAFGTTSELVVRGRDVAVKTGTTNDVRDNWAVGYTPEYLAITWVGNNDGSPMRNVASGLTGASPIWNRIMTHLLRYEEPVWPDMPEGVQEGMVCVSGIPPREDQYGGYEREDDCYGDDCQVDVGAGGCGPMRRDIFWDMTNPTRSTVFRGYIYVDEHTGVPPEDRDQRGAREDGNEYEERHGLRLENRLIHNDPLTDLFCVDCHRQVGENGRTVWERHFVSEAMGARMFGD